MSITTLKRPIGFGIVVAIGAVGVALGFAATRLSGSGGAQSALPESTPADEAIRYVVDTGKHEEQVFAMAWSATDDLWFVGSRADGSLSLNRYSPRTGGQERWDLPVKASPGPHTYLIQEDESSWWIAANYTLVLFDSEPGSAVVSTVLPEDDALATDDALNPGTPEPGTWINGMLRADDGALLLTRNNVRGILQVQQDGQVTVQRELDVAPSGLASVGGSPLAYQAPGSLAEAAGYPVADEAMFGVAFAELRACDIILDPGTGELVVATEATSNNAQTTPLTADDPKVAAGDIVAASASGETFAAAIGQGSAIVRGGCSGELEVFQLPVGYTRSDDPTHRGPTAVSGDGVPGATPSILRMANTVLALAVGPNGEVAFSDSAMQVAVID